MSALYVSKRIVGWLAVLAWISWFIAIFAFAYVMSMSEMGGVVIGGAPFGSRELPWPDRIGTAKKLEEAGALDPATAEPILREYVETEVSPKIVNGRGPVHEKLRNVQAALVLDPSGKAVAAYPETLTGIEYPFPYALSIMPAEKGYFRGVPYPSDYVPVETGPAPPGESAEEGAAPEPTISKGQVNEWYRQMHRLIRRQVPSDCWILMDPITDKNGNRIGALVTATNRYLDVNYGPDVLGLGGDLGLETTGAIGLVGFLFLAHFLTTAWVFLDGKWRGTNGIVWALVYFVASILGLALFLIARPPDPVLCPRCSKRVARGHVSCPYCGLEIRTRCPACGHVMLHEWRYCPKCNLDTWEVMPAAPAAPAAPAVPAALAARPVRPPREIRHDLARPEPRPGPAGHTITIHVFDAETGEAVRNAKVTCKGPTEQAVLLTDAEGRIEARNAKPGIYKMLVRATGYREEQLMEDLKEGGTLDLVVRVAPLPGRVSGNVYDADTKLPLAGARVRSDSSRVRIEAVADTLGRFQAAGVSAGPCILTCEYKDYVKAAEPCVIPPGGDAMIDFALTPMEGKGIPVAPIGEKTDDKEQDAGD